MLRIAQRNLSLKLCKESSQSALYDLHARYNVTRPQITPVVRMLQDQVLKGGGVETFNNYALISGILGFKQQS